MSPSTRAAQLLHFPFVPLHQGDQSGNSALGFCSETSKQDIDFRRKRGTSASNRTKDRHPQTEARGMIDPQQQYDC